MNPSEKESSTNRSSAEPSAPGNGNAEESAAAESSATVDHERKLKDAENRALRLQAELENFRRRARREADEQLKYAAIPLLSDLIEVADNLRRALSAAEADTGEALHQGVQMVQHQLEQVLERHGCKRIAAEGSPFDPHFHAAVRMEPSRTVPANTIIAETRSGYMLYDRVVRPADVIVSTGPRTAE
jgi:molecular chaperone GrpE